MNKEVSKIQLFKIFAVVILSTIITAFAVRASTITTILGTDTISSSRTTINTNFSNLNTDKAELSGATFTGLLIAPNASVSSAFTLGSADAKFTFRPSASAGTDKLSIYNNSNTEIFSMASSGYVTISNQINISGAWTQFQATSAGVDLNFKTVSGSGRIVFSPNATDTLIVDDVGASLSTNFEITGYASASKYFGVALSNLGGTTGCSGSADTLNYNSTTGVFSCGTDSGASAAGSDTYVQFNDAGVFNGVASMTFNKTLARFTVDGSASVSEAFGIQNNTASASLTLWGNSSAGTDSRFKIVAGNTPERLNIFNGTDTKLVTISSSGNVGIGEPSPDSTGYRAAINSNNQSGLQIRRNTTTTNDEVRYGMRISSSVGTDSGYFGLRRLNSPVSGDSAIVMGNIKNGSLSESLRIDSAGLVGIGTTAPTAMLHVVGDATTLFNVASGSNSRFSVAENGYIIANSFGTDNNFTIGRNSNEDLNIKVDDNNATFLLDQDETGSGDNHGYFWNIDSSSTGQHNFSFQDNSVGRFYIANGVAGLGTFTTADLPTAALHIRGDASTLLTIASGSSSLFQVSEAGNVSIGVTNLLNKLYVSNGGNITPATVTTYPFGIGRTTTADVTIGSDASFGYIQSWNSLPLKLQDRGNNTIINATSGGNVGIGTASPTTKLDISGSASISANFEVTGIIKFDGATSLAIPNSSGGTSLAAAGQITFDTASASFNIHDGSAERVMARNEKCYSAAVLNPTAKKQFTLKRFNDPFTITSVSAIASGSNAAGWNLRYGAGGSVTTTVFTLDKSASTSAYPVYSSFANSAISDGGVLDIKIASASATLASFTVNVCGRYNP